MNAKNAKLLEIMQTLYNKLDKLKKWQEALLIWAFSIVLVFGVVCLCGTLTSGFHLVDDWEYAKYVNAMTLDGQSLWECMKGAVRHDLNLRFRPLYYINRVMTAAVFGINLTAMSVLKASEIVVALVALYYCARRMRCNVAYSLLFSLTVMVGYQSVVWWKLGPQESYGIMLFSISFYFLLNWLQTDKARWAVASVAVYFLLSLYKEPFLLLIPFVMLYVVYDQMKREKNTPPHLNLLHAIKARFPYLLAMGIIFMAAMIIILFFVGTNNYDYVGLDATLTFDDYQQAWSKALHADLKWYARFGTVMCLIMLTFWDELKKLGWEIFLTLAILIPQVVTYSKTAITERYILPSSFAIAFFFIIVGCNWKALVGKRRTVYVLCLLLMLAAHGRVMLREANYFTYRGNSIKSAFDKSLQYTKDHEGAKVLSCFGPNKEGNYTIYYWMRLHGCEDVYYWNEDSMLISEWMEHDVHDADDDILENMDVVVMYNREDRHWCYEPSLDLSDFTEENCGTITIYTRE